jgi:hypothetical protein
MGSWTLSLAEDDGNEGVGILENGNGVPAAEQREEGGVITEQVNSGGRKQTEK